jgi:hypothetical protein
MNIFVVKLGEFLDLMCGCHLKEENPAALNN